MSHKTSFTDPDETIEAMMDEFLVICPKCQSCASIRRRDPSNPHLFAPRRLLCLRCGHAKDWAGRELFHPWHDAEMRDSVFHLPLWLQTPCCGKTLWAYNPRHLEFLENYVRAALRTRTVDPQFGWANQSLAARLPKWITSAKNRDAVLKGIEKLKARLAA